MMTVSDFPTNRTEELKHKQRQAVLDSKVVYEWHCYLRPGGKLFFAACGAGSCALVVLIFCCLANSFAPLYLGIPAILITTPMIYHLMSVDEEYRGQVTSKGIIEYRTEVVPDIFYKINRWMGYIGAVTCALAAILIGPAAFVGAGGFALMALVRGERERTITINVIPWAEHKPYEFKDNGPRYANSITSYWYYVKDYYRTNYAGLNSARYTCPEELFPKIDAIVRQYIEVTEFAEREVQPE
ncbi:hypothetical protein L4C34_04420 [Vibrio profundum]|uniref:hypothetical protein n=1 Tax=Vibrio profundum TaxID=2910247 RepID=UPI003D0AB037